MTSPVSPLDPLVVVFNPRNFSSGLSCKWIVLWLLSQNFYITEQLQNPSLSWLWYNTRVIITIKIETQFLHAISLCIQMSHCFFYQTLTTRVKFNFIYLRYTDLSSFLLCLPKSSLVPSQPYLFSFFSSLGNICIF